MEPDSKVQRRTLLSLSSEVELVEGMMNSGGRHKGPVTGDVCGGVRKDGEESVTEKLQDLSFAGVDGSHSDVENIIEEGEDDLWWMVMVGLCVASEVGQKNGCSDVLALATMNFSS